MVYLSEYPRISIDKPQRRLRGKGVLYHVVQRQIVENKDELSHFSYGVPEQNPAGLIASARMLHVLLCGSYDHRR